MMDSSGGWEEGPLDMRKYEIWQRWMSGHVVEICQVEQRSSHSTARANYDLIPLSIITTLQPQAYSTCTKGVSGYHSDPKGLQEQPRSPQRSSIVMSVESNVLDPECLE